MKIKTLDQVNFLKSVLFSSFSLGLRIFSLVSESSVAYLVYLHFGVLLPTLLYPFQREKLIHVLYEYCYQLFKIHTIISRLNKQL